MGRSPPRQYPCLSGIPYGSHRADRGAGRGRALRGEPQRCKEGRAVAAAVAAAVVLTQTLVEAVLALAVMAEETQVGLIFSAVVAVVAARTEAAVLVILRETELGLEQTAMSINPTQPTRRQAALGAEDPEAVVGLEVL